MVVTDDDTLDSLKDDKMSDGLLINSKKDMGLGT